MRRRNFLLFFDQQHGHEINFYARKQLLLSARLSHRNSVCLSVTRVDQSKTVQGGSPNFHRRLPGRLYSFRKRKALSQIQRGSPQTNEKRVGKICDFWPIRRCISV